MSHSKSSQPGLSHIEQECQEMFYYIEQPCKPYFPIGLVKTESDFIVRSVETGSGRRNTGGSCD